MVNTYVKIMNAEHRTYKSELCSGMIFIWVMVFKSFITSSVLKPLKKLKIFVLVFKTHIVRVYRSS